MCLPKLALHAPMPTALLVAALFVPHRQALAQGTGTLRGTVTASERHDSIAGACVALRTAACSAITDARGAWTVRGVPAGEVAVTVTAVGRLPQTSTIAVEAGRTAVVDVALAPGPLMLSTMVVTATRVPTRADQVASTVNVLTPEAVATSPARESQDLLREIPGVELPRTSSLVGGTAQIVSIRGVDEGRTAVLFDNIPVNDAWGEWIDWGRVPKGMIDHVEVVEGGTSNLYGNGAIGGVISFVSRPLAPGSVLATVDGGSRDAKHGFLAFGVPIAGPLTAYVSGDYLADGGYLMLDPAKAGPVDEASNVTQRNGYFRLNYEPSPGVSAFASMHLFGDTRHLGTSLSLATRHQHDIDAGLNYGALASGLFTARAWTGHLDEYQRATTVRASSSNCASSTTAPRACEDSASSASIPSDDQGASLVWSRAGLFGLESFTVGADYRHMGGEYDETDFNTTCPGAGCHNITRTILSGGDQYLSGAFAQAIIAPVAPLRIELSARADHWQNNNGHSIDAAAGDTTYANRSKSAVSPRVGARYAVDHALSFHAAYYGAFRAPNLAELYRKQISATSVTIPNPDLDAETGRGWEAGLDWQPMRWVQLKGTAYVADYNHFNVPVVLSAGPPSVRQRLNINKSRSTGGEIYLTLRPAAGLLLSGSANYDNDRVVADDSTNGRKINRVPSPKYTVRASYASRRLGTWTALYRYEGQTTTLQGVPLAPFGVVDANVQREIGAGLTAFVSVENITDEQYQINISGSGANTLISYGLPRTIRVGLDWSR